MDTTMSVSAPETDEKKPAEVVETVAGLDDDAGKVDKYEIRVSDGVCTLDDRGCATLSTVLRNAIEGDPSAMHVTVPGESVEQIQYVTEYLAHHKGVVPQNADVPIRTNVLEKICKDPWDAAFVRRVMRGKKETDVDALENVTKLAATANHLIIPSLCHLMCVTIASRIKFVPVDRIKAALESDWSSAPQLCTDVPEHAVVPDRSPAATAAVSAAAEALCWAATATAKSQT